MFENDQIRGDSIFFVVQKASQTIWVHTLSSIKLVILKVAVKVFKAPAAPFLNSSTSSGFSSFSTTAFTKDFIAVLKSLKEVFGRAGTFLRRKPSMISIT